jgi:hypothetical protein
MFTKFSTERQWNSDHRRVRQCVADFEIGPALIETFVRFGSCDVERVVVNAIDLRERFNEVESVAFVSPKLRPYRMSIDCDPQSVSPVSLLFAVLNRPEKIYWPWPFAAA